MNTRIFFLNTEINRNKLKERMKKYGAIFSGKSMTRLAALASL